MRKFIVGAILGVTVIGAGGSTAFAGEINGNNQPTPVNSYVMHSICAFSGLNDNPDDPIEGGKIQSWGAIPRDVRDQLALEGEHPGDACNGHTGFLAGGGGE